MTEIIDLIAIALIAKTVLAPKPPPPPPGPAYDSLDLSAATSQVIIGQNAMFDIQTMLAGAPVSVPSVAINVSANGLVLVTAYTDSSGHVQITISSSILGEGNFDIAAFDGSSPPVYSNTINLLVMPVPDTTAPNTTISSAEGDSGPITSGGTTTSTSATFNYSSTENATFETWLDAAGTWVSQGSATSVQYTGLAVGTHSFRVRSIDAAGNVDSTPSVFQWTVVVTSSVDLLVRTLDQATSTPISNVQIDVLDPNTSLVIATGLSMTAFTIPTGIVSVRVNDFDSYTFVQWGNGDLSNPRTLTATGAVTPIVLPALMSGTPPPPPPTRTRRIQLGYFSGVDVAGATPILIDRFDYAAHNAQSGFNTFPDLIHSPKSDTINVNGSNITVDQLCQQVRDLKIQYPTRIFHVAYDPEGWDQTAPPEREVTAVPQYAKIAADIVHSYGHVYNWAGMGRMLMLDNNWQEMPYADIDIVTFQWQNMVGNPENGTFGWGNGDPVVTLDTVAKLARSINPNIRIHMQCNVGLTPTATIEKIEGVVDQLVVLGSIDGVGCVNLSGQNLELFRRLDAKYSGVA